MEPLHQKDYSAKDSEAYIKDLSAVSHRIREGGIDLPGAL